MKLRLSYIGINTDVQPPILFTESGVAVQASANSLHLAFVEASEYCAALEKLQPEWSGSQKDPHERKEKQ